jgi:hypothetical protein
LTLGKELTNWGEAQNGVVFQKDLGTSTAALGASMAQFNPDATWKVVE